MSCKFAVAVKANCYTLFTLLYISSIWTTWNNH